MEPSMSNEQIEKNGADALLVVEDDPSACTRMEQHLAKYVRLLRFENATYRLGILKSLGDNPFLEPALTSTAAEIEAERSHL